MGPIPMRDQVESILSGQGRPVRIREAVIFCIPCVISDRTLELILISIGARLIYIKRDPLETVLAVEV